MSAYNLPMPSLHVIYASTSGHTEYIAGELAAYMKQKHADYSVTVQRVEHAKPEDMLTADLLVLASSTWNTNNIEGQLNPHMYHFLMDLAKSIDLNQKKTAVIGLGDARYFYTCKAADHLEHFVRTHNGQLVEPTLRIINEPYGQEGKVTEWAETIVASFSSDTSA
ncbi:MAG: hypothetical protein JWM56_473 [Candidatus Peribacteria bacterium]|nr:hypothetical protein [Candidatus Peribacteria bacterium]